MILYYETPLLKNGFIQKVINSSSNARELRVDEKKVGRLKEFLPGLVILSRYDISLSLHTLFTLMQFIFNEYDYIFSHSFVRMVQTERILWLP